MRLLCATSFSSYAVSWQAADLRLSDEKINLMSQYDPQSLSEFFDGYGRREWDRLVATPVDEISLHLHTLYLETYIHSGARVLEIGAGAGRFTQVLAGLGARVLVADISPGQLALNREMSARLGFAQGVEDWQVLDICDLSIFPEAVFDAVIAYGGVFSYVLDRRDAALQEALRVLRPGGLLLGSVMTIWGSAHRALPGVLDLPPEVNQQVTTTGDLTPDTIPGRPGNYMHMFRSTEVGEWLLKHQLEIQALSASGVLATGWGSALEKIRGSEAAWGELLRMEREASASAGCLDMGTHLIFVARKASGSAP